MRFLFFTALTIVIPRAAKHNAVLVLPPLYQVNHCHTAAAAAANIHRTLVFILVLILRLRWPFRAFPQRLSRSAPQDLEGPLFVCVQRSRERKQKEGKRENQKTFSEK